MNEKGGFPDTFIRFRSPSLLSGQGMPRRYREKGKTELSHQAMSNPDITDICNLYLLSGAVMP